MGGGITGWLTPGWMYYEPKFAPHIAKPDYVDTMLKNAEDPKPEVKVECEKQCLFWKGKLTRCEQQLELVIKVNPTKTCLYPMRDWVTCVEACTQPIVHNALVGTQ